MGNSTNFFLNLPPIFFSDFILFSHPPISNHHKQKTKWPSGGTGRGGKPPPEDQPTAPLFGILVCPAGVTWWVHPTVSCIARSMTAACDRASDSDRGADVA